MGKGVGNSWGVAVGTRVGSGATVGFRGGVAVGRTVGMTWGVTVGIASTMACARRSISWLSSSSVGPQAGRTRARPTKTRPASAHRI